jgi:O-antigen biosynthesis protein
MPKRPIGLPEAVVDTAVGFAGHLLLFGWCTGEKAPNGITLWDCNGVRRSLPPDRIACFPRPACHDPTDEPSERDHPYRFILRVNLLDLIGLDLFATPLSMQVETGRKAVARAEVAVTVLEEHRTRPDQFIELLASAARHDVVDRMTPAIALALVHGAEQEFEFPHSIELVNRLSFGFFVEGWIEEARSRCFHYISTDGLYLATPRDVMHKARPDVTAHLINSGTAPRSDDHGFLVSFAPLLPDTSSFFVFSIVDDEVYRHGNLKATPSELQAQILEMIMHSAGPASLPVPEVARSYLLPVFAEKAQRPEYDASLLHDNGVEPRVSIVIPLFREHRFIYSLMLLQKYFPAHYEWIIISDDPAIHHPISEVMKRRRTFFSSRTTLVLNRFSQGFAGANNVGVSLARGEYILFMNSDIWIDSPIPIERALSALNAGRFGIMGFRLLYEDGSIQHDGMAFRIENLMHGLYVVDHPAKGTPPCAQSVDIILSKPAVTGALMMMSKNLYLELGGFDRAYVRGDFEDADLCLRARAAGHKIGLVPSNEIFHLERQSIGGMGSDTSRSALVYLNCITFNRRWRTFIDRDEPGWPVRESAQ